MKNENMPLSILASVVSISDFRLPDSVTEALAPSCTLVDYAITDLAIGSLKLASAIVLDTP